MNIHYGPPIDGPFLTDETLTLDSPMSPAAKHADIISHATTGQPASQKYKPGSPAPVDIGKTFDAVGTLGNAIANGWQPTPAEATVMFSAMLLLKNGLKVIGIEFKDDKAMTMAEAEQKMRAAINKQVAAVDESVALSALQANADKCFTLADKVLGTDWRQNVITPKDAPPTRAQIDECLIALGRNPQS